MTAPLIPLKIQPLQAITIHWASPQHPRGSFDGDRIHIAVESLTISSVGGDLFEPKADFWQLDGQALGTCSYLWRRHPDGSFQPKKSNFDGCLGPFRSFTSQDYPALHHLFK